MSDEDLRKVFRDLREDDTRRAPPFEELVRRGAPRPARSRWAIVVPITSVAAAAAVLVIWLGTGSPDAAAPTTASAPAPAAAPMGGEAPMGGMAATRATASLGADREPLGFLLTLPGSAALNATLESKSFGEASP